MSGAIPRDKRTCGNCWWFEPLRSQEPGLGECFQAPPMVVSTGPKSDDPAWTCRPDVDATDRACSKWEDK